MKSWKIIVIIVGIVLGFLLLISVYFMGVNNRVISLEEQIKESTSSVNVQEKRRLDLLTNLVDTVKSYTKYESETMNKIVDARSKIDSGDFEGATTILNAVVEQYPDLKANEHYKQVMTEMSITENLIAEYRENYNIQVKSYNKYTRRFPNNIILTIVGYDKVDYDYLDYYVSSDAPTDLWS